MKEYTVKERIQIQNDFLEYFTIEELNKYLFNGFINNKEINCNSEIKVNEIYYKLTHAIKYSKLNNRTREEIKNITLSSINALKDYEYFCTKIEFKKREKYNEKEYIQKYDKLGLLKIKDGRLNITIPSHPRDIKFSTFTYMVDSCNLDKNLAKTLLKVLLPEVHTLSYSKHTKLTYNNIISSLERLVKKPQCERDISEQEKQFQLEKLKTLKSKINKKIR